MTKKQIIEWHPYPDEVPPKTGLYLLSVSVNHLGRKVKIPQVTLDWFSKRYFLDFPEDGGFEETLNEHVLAWAKAPTAYIPNSKEDK